MSRIKLFCLPYAGSSAMIYYQWSKFLSQDIDLQPVELAGRGSRMDAPLYESINGAAQEVCCSIKDQIKDTPYAIFGHSMGSWIAFELYHEIIKSGLPMPEHLFFSGNRAPHLNVRRNKIIHNLPENEFKNAVLKLGGTPKSVFEDKALADIFVPLIRADYKITETYQYIPGRNKIECGVSALCGREDSITQEDMEAWREHVLNKMDVVYFDGGHFFLNQNIGNVTSYINQRLKRSDCRVS
ncbi:thioesterase domain-containing protein [Lacrimispora sp.]|jgi:surfactin synthase thioesterase subunit|uniref:thioesterase II family protein n=1 Tax=Lacrimispora sp. TaxID=2719234 RepID=UPI0029E71AB9|nr:hypothetical protein [Lacrimispora sp.]